MDAALFVIFRATNDQCMRTPSANKYSPQIQNSKNIVSNPIKYVHKRKNADIGIQKIGSLSQSLKNNLLEPLCFIACPLFKIVVIIPAGVCAVDVEIAKVCYGEAPRLKLHARSFKAKCYSYAM